MWLDFSQLLAFNKLLIYSTNSIMRFIFEIEYQMKDGQTLRVPTDK